MGGEVSESYRPKTLDGIPVRQVPRDFRVRYPLMDLRQSPILAWWAQHDNGTFTPVYHGAILPDGRRA